MTTRVANYGSVAMAPAIALPSGGTTSLLLEREAQVAALEALAEAARSGGGRLVVIEGSAGIGKTRLLAEARAIAGGAGMRVLAARGGEFEGGFAYGIVRQLFEPLLAPAAADLRAELLSGPAALVEPLVGASRPAASQDEAAEGSFAILHGLYWLAANAALQQPTLLAIDDLYWADTPSLRWLLYLARRLEGVPLLIAAATRPPEGEGRDPTLVAELMADPEVVAIRPEPLGCASIGVLARELHGLEPDEAFCAALETATGGKSALRGRRARRGGSGGNQPDRGAGASSARDRSPGRFSRRRASPRPPAVGGACPPPCGLDPRRRGRAAPRGRSRRREGERAWSGGRSTRSARPAPARGSARVLPPGRPQRRLRDPRCRRTRRRPPLGR